ncbi:hypothetical protein V8C34DRAFT_41345 [Trichoderma compactum]
MTTQVLTKFQSVELQPAGNLPGSAPVEALHDPSRESSPATPAEDGETPIIHSKARATFVVAQLLGLNLFSSFCNGVVVVGLPAMAASLHINLRYPLHSWAPRHVGRFSHTHASFERSRLHYLCTAWNRHWPKCHLAHRCLCN